MSYGLLKYGSKMVEMVEVYNDLEAFFYIILYYAIRYIDSNCRDVATFIEDFFDCYTIRNGEYYVGQKKKTAITRAEIEVEDEVALEFTKPPLNELVRELLQSFSTHYRILRYEARQEAIPKFRMPPAPAAPSESPDVDDSEDPDIFLVGAHSAPPRQKARAATTKKKDEFAQPTEEERILAKNVTNHNLFLGVVCTALYSKAWGKGSAWKGDLFSH